MNLKNKLAIITSASMLAFAGVGFAAWTFNNSVAQTQDAGNYVTSALSANNVALSGNTTVYLVLDQSKPYWSNYCYSKLRITKPKRWCFLDMDCFKFYDSRFCN